MTPHQMSLIKSTWSCVVPIADTAAALFYSRLFEIDHSTRELFRDADMPEQRKKLVQALGEAWSREAHDAWATAYGSITEVMQGGARNTPALLAT